MIPKRLFFTWFNENIPEWVIFSMNMFQKINPDFEIQFIHFTINQIEDIFYSDGNNLNDSTQFLYNAMHNYFEYAKQSKNNWPFVTSFNDYYRIQLLRKYGGIYLDCDMFPIKPFDDFLLNRKSFHSSRLCQGGKILMIEENFAGCIPNSCSFDDILPPIYEFNKTQDLQDKFYNCILSYGEFYGNKNINYVDHYGYYSWNPENCKIPCTKMDNELMKLNNFKINFN